MFFVFLGGGAGRGGGGGGGRGGSSGCFLFVCGEGRAWGVVDFRMKGIRVEDDMHINQLDISLFMSKGAPSCGGYDLMSSQRST